MLEVHERVRGGRRGVAPDRHRTTTTSGCNVTPTVIQRLHEVLSAERVELGSHGHHDFDTWVWMTQRTDTVIAAVEQALAAKDAEIAELRRKCPDCGSPMPGEMCAVCALAIAEAEIAELRKRPTLEEVEEAVDAVCATWEGHDMGKTIVLLAVIRKLYAEKARAEAPK